jgi:hypothetical protein
MGAFMLAATLTIRLNGLKNIVAFQIRIIIQEFFDSEPSANLANNHRIAGSRAELELCAC